ncbi:MAG: 2-oxoisovalerate dehydrogenase [Gammaproteobacteria bacterium]|nr:2-oxoisovalerate dehydrogenase [Gammaproteobacteria bacterium]MYF03149.1 2-oxoisovalerate dehydrogenase [Gammaproteobacteria bacterium]MYI76863.1 2-oxoisovalerate dehydrogenase [Gammaproteobacteria bacterium]
MQGIELQSNEIVFEVIGSAEGGYSAHALRHRIFTEGEDWEDLKAMVRDAVLCHFEDTDIPTIARLEYARVETITI